MRKGRLLPILTERKPTGRSRITNRKQLLPKVDGRVVDQRRFKDLVCLYARELGHDPTEGELALIKQTASATVASEMVQSRVLAGLASAAELGELSRLGNLVMRGLIHLGLTRSKHPEHQPESLHDYLRTSDEVPL